MAEQAPRLPLIRFSTDDFPEPDRYDAWRTAMAPMFDTIRADASLPFHGSAFTVLLGSIAFGGTDVDPLAYVRSAERIRGDMVDHYLVRLDFTPEDREGVLRIIDLGQPITLETAPMHCLCMFVPRDLVDGAMSGMGTLHGRIVRDARGRIFADYLKSLARSLPEMRLSDAPATVDATVALMRSSLAPSRDADAEARSVIDATQIGRARRLIDARLESPALGPELLMRELGMSRASLYRLFQPLGGVARFIQARRLQRVHDLLSSPAEGRQIGELAYSYGFADEASFSRAFRRAYGYTASEARAMRGTQRIVARAGGSTDIALSPPQRMMMWGEWMHRLAS